MRRVTRLAAALLALALATPAAAATPTRAGAQFRYWSNTDHNDNRDYLAYWARGPFHALLEVWEHALGEFWHVTPKANVATIEDEHEGTGGGAVEESEEATAG